MKEPKKKKEILVASATQRDLTFPGNSENNSILLGDYGDAKITATGNFKLSGIVLCRKNTLELYLDGTGTISLQGHCKTLLIKNISGECTLDVTGLACRKLICESATGKAVILLGRTRVIEQMVIGNDVQVRYPMKAVSNESSVRDNLKIGQTVAA
jgi:hypothetical protein